MKYHVYAKFLGSYMPERRAKIGDCVILKSEDQYRFDDDRPTIPITSKGIEVHSLRQSVNNYIYYPQRLISVRTFESEYLITTEVETDRTYEALQTAGERFSDVASALSLVAKNKMVRLHNRRRRRKDEIYDFEIIGLFLKKNGKLIRLKLPSPGASGRNFFPQKFPKSFLSQAKKYLASRDPVFRKGLIYFQRATTMKHSGVFSDLEIVLNLVKCIELICWHIGDDDRFGMSKKDYKNLGTKKAIEYAGKKIGVTNKGIKSAKHFWDARNRGDIAHKDLYFNPYSSKSSNAFVNVHDLEGNATEFLVKYWKYRQGNSRLIFS